MPTFYDTFNKRTTDHLSFSYTMTNLPSFEDTVKEACQFGGVMMLSKPIPIDFGSRLSSCKGHTMILKMEKDKNARLLKIEAAIALKKCNHTYENENEVFVLDTLTLEGKDVEGVLRAKSTVEWICGSFQSFTMTKDQWQPSINFIVKARVYYRSIGPGSLPSPMTTVSRPKIVTGKLAALLFSEAYSDIMIKCDSETFPAHRIILGASSPVFSTMMTIDMKEKQDNVITMNGTSPPVCKEMLRFIYTAKVVTTNWSLDFTQELYDTAKMYELTALMAVCERKLLSLITVDNVRQVLNWALLHELKNVEQVANNFIVLNTVGAVEVFNIDDV